MCGQHVTVAVWTSLSAQVLNLYHLVSIGNRAGSVGCSIVPFCSTLKTQKQYPPAQHPISALSFPRHNETSFHKQGAFHESFITKPLALFPNKPFCGSKLRLIQFSLAGAIVSSTTKRLSCHQANCQYRSCMLPTARTILDVGLRVSRILTNDAFAPSRCQTKL
jgi:hypothetical protein